MACAGLLVAAPLALFLAGGGDRTGTARDPEGVFTGDPDTGIGGGPGPSTPGVATESSLSPAPEVPPVDPAAEVSDVGGGSGTGGAAVAGGGGGSAGAGAGSGGGSVPVAGAQPAPAGGGTHPAPSGGGSNPGTSPGSNQQPAPQQPAAQQPTPPAAEKPCLCETVTDVVDGVTDPVTDTLGTVLP
ncbi:hypothetical protein [Blastococcus litoris]|uniref:hypothetical protein n=1 Tax=Blastococcus litoris TaxID=2171622 RepID=UPI0013E04DF0|nr:hypothetical protein [Blastococcus litoris]